MATEQERLRVEVAGLREAVTELVDLYQGLDAKVEAKVVTEIEAKGVGREEYRRRVRASGRRTVGALIFLLIVIVVAVGWNRITLMQAQDQANEGFRRLIETCRTTGPPLSPRDLAFCNQRVPGFDQARQRAIDTAATTKANQERLARVERELAKLLE
jgi:hypothetical protein